MKTNYTKSMSIIPEFKRAFTNMKSAKYQFPNLNKGVQNNDSYTPIHFDHECENTNHSKQIPVVLGKINMPINRFQKSFVFINMKYIDRQKNASPRTNSKETEITFDKVQL